MAYVDPAFQGLKAGDPYPGRPGYVVGSTLDFSNAVRVAESRNIAPDAPGGSNNPISQAEAVARYGSDAGVNVSGQSTRPYVEGHDSREIPTTPYDLAFDLRNPNTASLESVKQYARDNPAARIQAERINEAYRVEDVPISNPKLVNPGLLYETTTSEGYRISLSSSGPGEFSVSGSEMALNASGSRLSELGLSRPDTHLYGTAAGEPGTVGGIPFTPASLYGYEKATGGVVQFYPQKQTGSYRGLEGVTPVSNLLEYTPVASSVKGGYIYAIPTPNESARVSDSERNFPLSSAVNRLGGEVAVKLEGDSSNLSPFGKAANEFLASGVTNLVLAPLKVAALVGDIQKFGYRKVESASLGLEVSGADRNAVATQAAFLGGGILLSTFKAGRVGLIAVAGAAGVWETMNAAPGQTFRTAGRASGDVASFFVLPAIGREFAKSRIKVSQGVPEARVSQIEDLTFRTRKSVAGESVYSDTFLGTKRTGTASAVSVATDRLGNQYPAKVGIDFLTFTQPSGKTTFLAKGAAMGDRAVILDVRTGGLLLPVAKGGPYQTFTYSNVGGFKSSATGFAYEATSTKGFYEFFPSRQMVAPASQVTRYPFEKTAFLNYEVAGKPGYDVTNAKIGIKTLGVFETIGKPDGELDLSRLGSFAPKDVFPSGGLTQTRTLYPPAGGGGVDFASLAPLRSGGGMAQMGAVKTDVTQVGGGVLSMAQNLAGESALVMAKSQNVGGDVFFSMASGAVALPRGQTERVAPRMETMSFGMAESVGLVSRQTQASRSELLPGLAMAPRTELLPRQAETTRSVLAGRIALLPDVSMIPQTILGADSVLVPRTQTTTRTVVLPGSAVVTRGTFAPGIEIIPTPENWGPPSSEFDLSVGFGPQKKEKRGKRDYGYTPSLNAIAFNIRASSVRLSDTGEGVRPVFSRNRRGSKPLFEVLAF